MNYLFRSICLITTLFSIVLSPLVATADVALILDELEAVDLESSEMSDLDFADIVQALLTSRARDLAVEVERLSTLATQGNLSATRSVAFAGWMSGAQTSRSAYWLAYYSPAVLMDFARAVPMVPYESVRNEVINEISVLARTGELDGRSLELDTTARREIQIASARALASMTTEPVERTALLTELLAKGIIEETDLVAPVYAALPSDKPRKVVEYWTLDMLKDNVGAVTSGRDFRNGQEMFQVATCIQCHAFGGEGKTIGPDLTEIETKYEAAALLEHILDPSLEVEEQYKSVIIEMKDRKEHFGTILAQDETTITVIENPLQPETAVTVNKSDIKLIDPIALSPMPQDLMIILEESEIWDLMAYLLSGNDPAHNAFAK